LHHLKNNCQSPWFFLAPEFEGRVTELQKAVREERQARKGAESNLTTLQEEMADLQAAKHALEKVGAGVNLLHLHIQNLA